MQIRAAHPAIGILASLGGLVLVIGSLILIWISVAGLVDVAGQRNAALSGSPASPRDAHAPVSQNRPSATRRSALEAAYENAPAATNPPAFRDLPPELMPERLDSLPRYEPPVIPTPERPSLPAPVPRNPAPALPPRYRIQILIQVRSYTGETDIVTAARAALSPISGIDISSLKYKQDTGAITFRTTQSSSVMAYKRALEANGFQVGLPRMSYVRHDGDE